MSGDGKWVAYVLQFTNTAPADTKPVLHIRNLETDQEVEVANATGASFSDDSQWIVYLIDPSGGRGGRGGRGRAAGAQPESTGRAGQTPAEPRRAELRNLATGTVKSWQDIASVDFAATSRHLLLRRRPAQAAGGNGRGAAGGGTQAPAEGGADQPEGPRGVDVIVHNLTTGRDFPLGSVADIAFNKGGDLLAYTVDAAVKDGNGLFVIELSANRIHPLDNDASVYNRLTWNEAGTSLAVLKGVEVEEMRERDNVLVAFPDIGTALAAGTAPAPVVLDPAKAAGFPEGWVVSDRAALSGARTVSACSSASSSRLPAPATGRRPGTDEVADVDVWNAIDERIQSLQMRRADADRNFTFRQAFDVASRPVHQAGRRDDARPRRRC